MKTRLDALEGDRLFDELNFGAGDFEAVEGENAEALDDWADDGQDLQSDEEDHEISSEGGDDQAGGQNGEGAKDDKNLHDDPENIWG